MRWRRTRSRLCSSGGLVGIGVLRSSGKSGFPLALDAIGESADFRQDLGAAGVVQGMRRMRVEDDLGVRESAEEGEMLVDEGHVVALAGGLDVWGEAGASIAG